MVYEKKFLLIAHYHQSGVIRKDLSTPLINQLSFVNGSLISTKLTKFEKKKLPKIY